MNFVLQLFIYVVLAIAGSILSSAEAQQKKQTPGVRGSRQVGGDNSLAFAIGKTGLGGHFEYWADWGNDGETPNAYHSEVYSLGDKPYNGLTGFFFDGARGTLRYDQPHAELGIPVEEARRDGKDHLWIKFYDGRQTVADAMLVARTAGQDRPWEADMIFTGCPYVVVTALSNREIFTGFPTYLFEVEGIDLYDMSLDSSVGGDGPQRLDDPSTWAYSNDPIVAASNVFFGIRYEGEWLYGGQKFTPYQLPADNWVAQIRKSKARGFTCGYEVVCGEAEPHAVIGEFLLAAAARIAEIGGLYKVLVGEPDAPVRSFTDDDIFITEQQELDPFPGLEVTCNVISSTYPEPAEAWGMKEAPSRYSSALEAEDDGRRLPKPIAYKAVYDAAQVQQLDKMAVEEARRFRTHINVMPPAWWEAEPLDAELWTSARNGYVNKTMLIIAIDDQPNADQLVARREVDGADYSWSSDMELPWEVSPLGLARPAPQAVSGEYVSPVPREIAYDAHWSASSVGVDVEFVRVSHRLPGDTNVRWTGLVPKPALLTGEGRISQNLSRATLYEVQIEYVPYSGRATIASDWMPVMIADVRTGPDDLTEELQATFDEVQQFLDEDLPLITDELADLGNDLDALAGAPVFVYGEVYAATDLVRYLGGIYRAIAGNTNVLPTDPASWEKVGDYNSVAGTVIGFTSRMEQVETKTEANADRIIQTTRDTRRIQNALMAGAMLNSEQGANQALENTDKAAAAATISETMRTEVSRIDGTTTALSEQINIVQSEVETTVAQSIASVTTLVEEVDGRASANAAAVNLLRAAMGGNSAEVQIKWESVAAPSGFSARYVLRAMVNQDGQLRQGSIFIDVPPDPNGKIRIGFSADETVFITADGTPLALIDKDGFFRSANGAVVINMLTGDASFGGV